MQMEDSKGLSYLCSDLNMQQWLNDVFQDGDIPSFEETPEFIESLKKIMNENESAEKDAKVMIKAEKKMKDFYDEKAKELEMVTDFIQLNSETCRRIQSLTLLAENMKLNEPSLTNFLLGMNEIEDKESIQAEKNLLTSHRMSVFSKKLKQTMKINEKMRRQLKSLTKVVEMQRSHSSEITNGIKYFENKEPQIDNGIQACKEKLESAGYLEEVEKEKKEELEKAGNLRVGKEQGSSEEIVYLEHTEIRHSELVKKAQKLKELEDHLETLENKLHVYNSLTPNVDNTVDAVKAKENELMQLENDLQKLLQGFETS